MVRPARSCCHLICTVVGSLAIGLPAGAQMIEDARSTIVRETSKAADIPQQADALVRLAWPPEGQGDPYVRAAARRELIDYGDFALRPLRDAVKTRDAVWQADIVATFIEAARTITSGQPPDLLPGLEEAIWFGSSHARRLAIREIGRHRFPPAVLPIIDAIDANPELTMTGIRALGQMGDSRARFFLGRVLTQGAPRHQHEAATALAQLGEGGLFVLRQAARSESRVEREAAFWALLSAALPEDADLFHRYGVLHPEDDPALLQRVLARAAELETQLEQKRDAEAAAAPEEDEP